MSFAQQYHKRRVLITGHTGFKGSWLAMWLQSLGAQVFGVALAPDTSPNHWDALNLDIQSEFIDIQDAEKLKTAITKIQPDIIFHLAAQPLVRASYINPIQTWNTNVMGTAHLLEACRSVEALAAIVIVTTDKCYQNQEWTWGYREIDPLGGHDAYSASKAASELVVQSYRQAFFNQADSPLLATARAGNVIGGGDWSSDRLIPDLVKSVSNQTSLKIRSPLATRPWQHVLDCLTGYLLLGQKLLDREANIAGAWNFGPSVAGNRTVSEILALMEIHWLAIKWECTQEAQPHEATLLHLDSNKARTQLGWMPVWSLEESVEATAKWYQTWLQEKNAISQAQLNEYISKAIKCGSSWAKE